MWNAVFVTLFDTATDIDNEEIMTDQTPKDENNPHDDNDNRQDKPPQPPASKINRGTFGWLMLVALAVMMFTIFNNTFNQAKEIKWGELLNFIESDEVEEILLQEDRIIAILRKDTIDAPSDDRVMVVVLPGDRREYVSELMKIAPDKIKSKPSNDLLRMILVSWLPMLLLFGLIWFLFFRAARGSGGGIGMLGNFGRSRHKVVSKEMTNVTLADVAGIEEAKDEVNEIIEFLRHPKKFQRLGGRIPRGVLLSGEPGCGKTLLAKAVAGEAEVPFFSISGSDFVEMFVGVGASRVRDLFKQAKENSPCIIFLDEIDAVGRRRGGGTSSGGHDEREQTLNAILVEMDGFETNSQVIVIAATNRPDVLDPALTRPGRFDRQIMVPWPDIRGRMEILTVHAKKVKMSPAIDMEKLARGTPMFTGADLEAVINEAAILATLLDKDFIEQPDLEEARDKVRFGRANKSRRIEEEERITTAYHEAGHAVIQYLLPHADPLHKVTIIPRGKAMGATFSLPEKDRYGYGRNYLTDTMCVLCGGRIAEERKNNDVSSGAAMDIQMATQYARHMVLEWGMSDQLGFIDYTPNENNDIFHSKSYSEETAKIVDEEVKKLIDNAYTNASRIIEENWEHLTVLADTLLQYETMTTDEVDQIMNGNVLTKPSVSDLIKAEAVKEKETADDEQKVNQREDIEPDTGALPSPA